GGVWSGGRGAGLAVSARCRGLLPPGVLVSQLLDRPLRILVAVPRIRLWLATVALAIAGCSGPFPQSTLHPRSDFARATDVLFTDIFLWAAAVFVVVELMLVVALVRFRHREGRRAR